MLRLPANIRRFHPQNGSRRSLPFPAAPNLRIAQLSEGAGLFGSARLFSPGRLADLEAFRPQVLAGSSSDLQCLAERAERGYADLRSVDRAIFVLTEWGEPPATDVFRVVLWQSFGVPVYELLIGPGGTLVASECEAHDGWHVEPGVEISLIEREVFVPASGLNRFSLGFSADLETESCPCGRAGMRLIHLAARDSAAGDRTLAAIA